jgi:DNA-binding transcriptional ArsR family regulator
LGFQISRAIYLAAELRIADLLADGAGTVEELAAATDTRISMLDRLLRALAGRGIVAERDDGRVVMTALAELLRGLAPGGSAWCRLARASAAVARVDGEEVAIVR